MTVVYRPARAEDLEFADALVVSSINDLTVGHGFGQMASPSQPIFQLFSLADDPDGLWVAEADGRILGFAWSWVCGDIWFLAQLFVSPDRQGGSIGNELIKRTLDHAEKSGASNRVLITFAFNAVSQGLYIRHGLFPRFPIYSVSAFGRSPEWAAIRMRSARRRSFDAGSPRAGGRAGAWDLAREAPPISHQRQPDARLQPLRWS